MNAALAYASELAREIRSVSRERSCGLMKFKLDENLPKEAVTILVQHGHDASTVAEQGISGCDDRELASV